MKVLVCMCAVLILLGCSERAPTATTPEHDGMVRAGSPSMAFVVQRLADGIAPVELPVPKGEDPATWRPGFDVIADYQGSMLIVLNGAGFEQWADSAALPQSRIVRTADAAGIELIRTKQVTHTHGTEGSHDHGGINPHTWLDPAMLTEQAEAVRAALQAEMPGHAGALESNLATLRSELAQLSAAWLAVDVSGITLRARSDAYAYLARAAGWSVEVDDATEPQTGSVMLDDVIELGSSAKPERYLDTQRKNIERLAQAAAKARGE